MSQTKPSVPVVLPPALDLEETELAARNEFLAENDFLVGNDLNDAESIEENADDDIILDENEAAGGVRDEQETKNLKSAKRRKSLLFLTVFGGGFGVFVLFISWVFGFGFFAAPSRVSVDRNQNANGANSSPSGSNDEKLKTALSLVATETENRSPVVSDNSTNPNALPEEDLKLNSDGKTNESSNNRQSGNVIVLPDENPSLYSSGAQNQIPVSQPVTPGTVSSATTNLPINQTSGGNLTVQPNTTKNVVANSADKTNGTGVVARSVFFGRMDKKDDGVSQNSTVASANISRQIPVPSSANIPPFGTLLPVRFLGAVYTLQRGSGGLVRMELSRTIQKQGFSLPAGTVIVGRLRGSEYNRVFISVFGAIDPKTGKLIKFEGDILGTDGASGVTGTRKSVKSWGTRFLNALRETGGQVVNLLASRGGRGGTIILGGTNGISGEVSSVVSGNSQADSFVIVRAGIDAYVLVSDLPGEQRDESESNSSSDTNIPGVNLSESEMVEILTTDDPNKIRALLTKMSPNQRALAIKAMEEAK